MEHGFTARRKTKGTRFDDAGVARADRDLEDALAFGDEVRKLVGGLDRDAPQPVENLAEREEDRKSTRLNSSHQIISYAVFCLKKKKNYRQHTQSSISADSKGTCPMMSEPTLAP